MAKGVRASSKSVGRSASKPAAKKASSGKRAAAPVGQVGVLSNLNSQPNSSLVVSKNTTPRTATYKKSQLVTKVKGAKRSVSKSASKSASKKTVKAPKAPVKARASSAVKKSASKKIVKRR